MSTQELPLISVIVPIYNSEKYLDRCIDSICNQSYHNLEVILVNDGSKDKSLSICENFAKKDSRIQIIDIPNGGVSNARNTGLKAAKGEFIQFLDSDDFMTPKYIEVLYNCIKKEDDVDFVICGIKSLNNELQELGYEEAGNHIIDLKHPDEDVFFQLFDKFLMFGPVNKLFKRELLLTNDILFDISLSYGEDLLFNLEYLRLISKVVITNEVYWCYIQDNTNSLSSKRLDDKFQIVERLHAEILTFLKTKQMDSLRFKALLHQRMFDCGYNDFAAIPRDSSLSFSEKKSKLKKLLNSPSLVESYTFIEPKKYANWIVFLMKHKLSLPYLFITKLL
ncbi:glycosyltransferase family 2 protein [Aquimarina sp. AD10]|uniref:glycosyltransferase family 2 protein n=1 Tax=Aquimarina TaxID=290174 RepID=UPI000E48785C|nr:MULTISPECIES: glycosyltransferase family A protein [Aquimarina]AXT59948.1 glycosyltransferase family 2 protein [Aquimarina sp. AD10]RKM95667.1 glycosyltransferase [Aquimarina sp. AD10]